MKIRLILLIAFIAIMNVSCSDDLSEKGNAIEFNSSPDNNLISLDEGDIEVSMSEIERKMKKVFNKYYFKKRNQPWAKT